MNFLGIDVRELDLPAFFEAGRLFYLGVFLAWAAWVWKSNRNLAVWAPMLLALVFWWMTPRRRDRRVRRVAPREY